MTISRILASTALLGALSVFAPLTYAKTCELSIDGNDAMQFSKPTLAVAADCTEVKLTLKHTGKLPRTAMGHNLVLGKTADMGAITGAALGDTDKAIAYLEKGYEERAFQMQFLKIDPRWDNLRDDPRFTDLMRRVGLSK